MTGCNHLMLTKFNYKKNKNQRVAYLTDSTKSIISIIVHSHYLQTIICIITVNEAKTTETQLPIKDI